MMMKGRTVLGISLSLIIINLAAIMEKADENLLPAVYNELGVTFHAGPSDLGYLTFICSFVQGIASPLAGVLVINHDRPIILAIGSVFWAVSTAAIGGSHYFWQIACCRAVNGFGLAIMIPAIQSFVADSYLEGERGTGFGLMYLVAATGGIGGGAMATVMASHVYWGLPGWRFAFLLMATSSCLIGLLVYAFVDDPRRRLFIDNEIGENSEREYLIEKGNGRSASIWKESWKATKAVVRVPTFRFIVLQGVVGSLPWTAMVFFTWWFQLIGFDHVSAASLSSIFAAGRGIGNIIGGVINDGMSRILPNSGRIICAQFSSFMGIPFSWVLLAVIPQSVTSYFPYAATLFFMGVIISWNGPASNAPMFAEVVPAEHRTMIYAFDQAFEGSFSAFAAPAVGILTEMIYGSDSTSGGRNLGTDGREAFALSRGLLSVMVVPFGLCCLLYTPLYWNFQRDRENARTAGAYLEDDDAMLRM